MDTFTPPPVYPEFSPEKSSNLKLVIFLGFVLVLIVIGISVWFLLFRNKTTENKNLIQEISTTTPISTLEMTDWKTYENKSWGYELKYPPDWREEYNAILSPDKKAKFVVMTGTCDFYNYSGEFEYQPYGTTTGSFVKSTCRSGMSIGLLVYGDNKELEKYQKTLGSILSTFKLAVDISTWKTYQNKKFLFEFKYPPEFKINVDENYSYVYIDFQKPDMPTNFVVSAKNTGLTADSIKEIADKNREQWQQIQFQNQNAFLITNSCDKKITFIKKGILYEITEPTSCSVPLDTKISKIYETFRIIDLDAELSSEITNGKIYHNEQYGFEFKYPNNWNLREGPINFDINSSMIIVRYFPKSKAPIIRCDQSSLSECTETKLADNLRTYVYLETGESFLNNTRLLSSGRKFFQDYAYVTDKNGNLISIDLFSNMQKGEAKETITAILSTLRFIK